MQETTWLTPATAISLLSAIAGLAGSFAVIRNSLANIERRMERVEKETISRREYDTQISALNSQLSLILQGQTRLEIRLNSALDNGHR